MKVSNEYSEYSGSTAPCLFATKAEVGEPSTKTDDVSICGKSLCCLSYTQLMPFIPDTRATCNCYLAIRFVTSKATRGWGGGDNHKLTEKDIATALLYGGPAGTAPQVAELLCYRGPCLCVRNTCLSLVKPLIMFLYLYHQPWEGILTYCLWDHLPPAPPIF